MKKLTLTVLGTLVFFLGYSQNPFILNWQVTSSDLNPATGLFEITIPINPDPNLNYSYTVDWGGQATCTGYTGEATYGFTSTGSYDIVISGDFPAIFFKNSPHRENILELIQWGDIQWQTMTHAFAGCTNLINNANDNPNLDEVTDLSYMFYRASAWDGDLTGWNVSTIRNMNGMFSHATSFNGTIENWEVQNVIDMTSMFESATSFDNNIGSWETNSLEEMSYMFANATSFNQQIGDWNTLLVTHMEGVFYGAINFNQSLDWDVRRVVSMHNLFSGASSFNQSLSWSTSGVRNMSHMFEDANSYNQDLGIWDISSVEDMRYMLNSTSIDECNYEATLAGWNTSAPSNIKLGASGLLYHEEADRNSLLGNGWEIVGDIKNPIDACGLSNEVCGVGTTTFFKTSWDIGADRTIEIRTNGAGYNYDIDWESDGIFDVIGATGTVQHTYPATTCTNNYQVSIRGTFPAISMWNSPYNHKITSIDQWGCIQWSSFSRAFEGCVNLTYNATDAPDISNATNVSMSSMFKGATIFNGDLSNWDVTNVTSMSSMFEFAPSFNGNIDNWNMTKISGAGIARMFLGATAFARDLSNWNITNAITSLNSTFMYCVNFDSDISGWDVSNVIDFHHTFNGASIFNQDLDNWVVSSATTMSGMFINAIQYDNLNSPLSWDNEVSGVIDMSNMFRNTEFNQDMSLWDVSSVTSMYHMFAFNEDFDQNINNWNVTNVTNFIGMFYDADAFNQPLNGWIINTTNNVSMSGMFLSANSFNQPLNNWNVTMVNNMFQMFSSASAFDQDLGSWQLNSIPAGTIGGAGSLENMLNNCGMSIGNYDATLIGWASNVANTASGILLGASGRKYCSAAAVTARNNVLTATPENWTIISDVNSCVPRIAPNPGFGNSAQHTLNQSTYSNGVINLRLKNKGHNNQIIGVKLYTINGQLISNQLPLNANNTLSIGKLSRGVYLLQVESTSGIETQKIAIND